MQGPIATVGSMHVCPMMNPTVPPTPHVGGPVTGPGAPGVTLNGKPVALMGDMCVCMGPPDVIAQGSTGVTVNGTPVATVGCLTAHGGAITTGEMGITIVAATPSPPATLAPSQIPFPKISPSLKAIASVFGKSGQLEEASKNQKKLQEDKAENKEREKKPLIYGLQWVKEERVVRSSKVLKKITLKARINDIPDGTSATIHIRESKKITDDEGKETVEAKKIKELTGTVKDKMVELIWEIEDEKESNS